MGKALEDLEESDEEGEGEDDEESSSDEEHLVTETGEKKPKTICISDMTKEEKKEHKKRVKEEAREKRKNKTPKFLKKKAEGRNRK